MRVPHTPEQAWVPRASQMCSCVRPGARPAPTTLPLQQQTRVSGVLKKMSPQCQCTPSCSPPLQQGTPASSAPLARRGRPDPQHTPSGQQALQPVISKSLEPQFQQRPLAPVMAEAVAEPTMAASYVLVRPSTAARMAACVPVMPADSAAPVVPPRQDCSSARPAGLLPAAGGFAAACCFDRWGRSTALMPCTMTCSHSRRQ